MGRSGIEVTEAHETEAVGVRRVEALLRRPGRDLILAEGAEATYPEVQPANQRAEAGAADLVRDRIRRAVVTGMQDAEANDRRTA